jgi:hypothetical protein
MKGFLLVDPETGSEMLIDPPDCLPTYALGTTVIGKVLDEHDQFVTIEGPVIGIEILQDLDPEDNTQSTLISYKVLEEKTKDVYHLMEDQIHEYYPETNEFNVAYHFED